MLLNNKKRGALLPLFFYSLYHCRLAARALNLLIMASFLSL